MSKLQIAEEATAKVRAARFALRQAETCGHPRTDWQELQDNLDNARVAEKLAWENLCKETR